MIRDHARQAMRAAGFAALTTGMLPLFLAHHRRAADEDKDTVRHLWVRRWARALLDLFAIDVVVRGRVPPPTKKGDPGRVIVANHRSAIDIGVLLATFGGTMLSRADLATWPIVGPAARAVGTVFVDRTNARSGAEAIRTIERHLTAGETIAIFPEGTTFEGDEVRPFHGGAFVAAARAKASILPVGLAYPSRSGAAFVNEPFLAHLARMGKSKATRMALVVGDPIEAAGRRAADLARDARAEVTSLVAAARILAGP